MWSSHHPAWSSLSLGFAVRNLCLLLSSSPPTLKPEEQHWKCEVYFKYSFHLTLNSYFLLLQLQWVIKNHVKNFLTITLKVISVLFFKNWKKLHNSLFLQLLLELKPCSLKTNVWGSRGMGPKKIKPIQKKKLHLLCWLLPAENDWYKTYF